MRTAWGYDVDTYLGPIISIETFNALTSNAYASNPRAEAALYAASQAIRNECGWHIVPSIKCVAYPDGGGIVTRLPAAYVSAVTSVTEDGEELTESDDFQWRRDGLLKRTAPYKWSDTWDGIEATYTAGYDPDAVPDLVEAVCSIATGVLSVTAGVISESADGVSVSYSASASSIAASLTAAQKYALVPYKVVSSHGA